MHTEWDLLIDMKGIVGKSRREMLTRDVRLLWILMLMRPSWLILPLVYRKLLKWALLFAIAIALAWSNSWTLGHRSLGL